MDFRPNEHQAMLRESAQRFLRDEYGFDRRRGHLRESADGMWRKIADLGWTGAALPEEAGGLGGSAVELSILMEEMGRALYVGPFLSSTVCAAILQAVGGRRAGGLLATVASGERRLALAHGEPGGRGFLDEASSTAREAAGAWLITGRKRLAYDVVSADLLVVTAAGPGGQMMFLVDPSAAGLVRRDYRTLDNGHASDLELDTAEAELLAGPAETARALDAGLYAAFIALGAEALGVADAALRHTQDYVAVRKQFGRALTDFQVIQHRIADMFVEIEQLRAALLDALSREAVVSDERRRAAMALKILAGQVAAEVAGQGLHLHGGMGMTDEMPISHYYRRARVIEAQFGNSDYFLGDYAKGLR